MTKKQNTGTVRNTSIWHRSPALVNREISGPQRSWTTRLDGSGRKCNPEKQASIQESVQCKNKPVIRVTTPEARPVLITELIITPQ